MKRVCVSALVAGALCSACVSMGTSFDPAAVAQLRPGMTREQVIQLMGKPNSVATGPDGRQQLIWVHSKGSMFGAEARSVALVFGPDGRLLQAPAQATSEIR